jgi:hypothetical protein
VARALSAAALITSSSDGHICMLFWIYYRPYTRVVESIIMARPTSPQSVAGGSPQVYAAILDALREGRASYRTVATAHGVCTTTVANIARREGIRRPNVQQVVAAQLHAGYHRAERVRLLDEALFAVEVGLETCDTPAELQHLVAAMSRLVRMRRLEEGAATVTTDLASAAARDEARAALAAKLDALAAHRADE